MNFNFGIEFPENDGDEINALFMSETEIDSYISGQKAKNTRKKDVTDMNTFMRFCESIFERRKIEDIPENELDNILCQFFMKAKTMKGKLYEPDTLSGLRNSLQRVLVERGSRYDLREGLAFSKSRKVLSSRRKELTKLGKGNKPNAARAISTEEVDLLFESEYFGIKNAVSLQRTVWWYITQHFGHRARDEGRQMQFGDVKLEKDFSSGCEYVVWITERSTKTRNGERPLGHKRSFNPKAFPTATDRCPVKIFKEYVSHRPTEMCQDDSPLFLQVRYNVEYTSNKIWYFPKPLGKNSVGEFMSKARKMLENNSAGKISNHSARKTTVTNLLNRDINPLHVQQITGHKKLESLNNYNTASLSQQKKISNAISSGSDISASNQNNFIPQTFHQQQLSQNWNPITPIFQGASINNCTFNINFGPNIISPPRKRRRVVIEDDSQ